MTLSTSTPARIDVPEGAFAGDEPLVAVERGGYVGSLHRGTIAVANPSGEVSLAVGDVRQPVFLRSAAKPFQVMPAVLSGGIEFFGLTQQELAILCASHAAEQRHIDTVLAVLDRIGLPEDALRCGIHPPIHQPTAEARIRNRLPPSPVCNNCSGAHTGMLVACRAMGWPIDTYGDPGHPLQIMTREILATFAALPADAVEFGIDNCAVPAFRLPIDHAATGFARLATGEQLPQHLAEAAATVRSAMMAHPWMIGGEDSFDSHLMDVAEGTVVCKGGAEGFQGVGMTGLALGMAIKISDGNARGVPPATMQVLAHLRPFPEEHFQRLERFRRPVATNLQGEVIGRVLPVFSIGHDA